MGRSGLAARIRKRADGLHCLSASCVCMCVVQCVCHVLIIRFYAPLYGSASLGVSLLALCRCPWSATCCLWKVCVCGRSRSGKGLRGRREDRGRFRPTVRTRAMGAGASTAGKGKKSVPSGAKALSTAAGSASEAKALFEKLDSNKDGRLSQADLREAVKKHGKDIKSDWSDELIGELFGFFDLDGDGLLDLEEFTSVLAEVKARGGRLDANDLKAQVARRVEEAERRAGIEKVWNRLVKEGNVWDKGCSGKLIRELNEENLWDDFGAKVTTWHAELCADESKKATANLEQFVAAYPRLLAETAEIRATWAREAEERTQAAAQAKAEEFLASKPEWEVPLKRLNEATAAAWAVGKTPLLVDMTTLKGDDRTAVFSPLETFFSYSGDVLIELKKAIVELSVKKEKSLEQVRAEARACE